MFSPFVRPRLQASTLKQHISHWFKLRSPILRQRLLREANAEPTYRGRQRRRAELGVGTLADYAWYGSTEQWERAKVLAEAGQEDLI